MWESHVEMGAVFTRLSSNVLVATSHPRVHCTLTVLSLYSHCTPTVLPPYSHCTPTVLPPYSHRTPTVPPTVLPPVLPLYSHCTPTVLPLCSHCTPTVLPLYSHCAPTVLPPYSHRTPHCTPTVLPLYSHCTPTVLPLCSHCTPTCTPTVLPPYSHCTPHRTPTVLPLYSHRTPTVLPLYSHRTPTVLPPYSHCAPTVLPLYSHCTPTVLPPYSHRTPTVLPPYSHCTPTVLLYSTVLPLCRLVCGMKVGTFWGARLQVKQAHTWTHGFNRVLLCTASVWHQGRISREQRAESREQSARWPKSCVVLFSLHLVFLFMSLVWIMWPWRLLVYFTVSRLSLSLSLSLSLLRPCVCISCHGQKYWHPSTSHNAALLPEDCCNYNCFGIHMFYSFCLHWKKHKKIWKKAKSAIIPHRTPKWTGENDWHLFKMVRNNCISSMWCSFNLYLNSPVASNRCW